MPSAILRAPVVCAVVLLLAASSALPAACAAEPAGAAGYSLRTPPTSLGGPARLSSPLLSGGASGGMFGSSSSGNLSGIAVREPPRQLFTSAAPLNFDPYAAPSPGPVLSAQPAAAPDLDEAIWDDVTGVYNPDAYHDWTAQLWPHGLIYRSYLAGVKESRMSTVFSHDHTRGWLWDIRLGGRVGIFRYGTTNAVRPEGFQLDIEGSGQPQLDLENNRDLSAVDFRAGLPLTYGIGRWQSKFAYYHLSSHVGDEYLVRNPGFMRVNYVRDALVLGQSYYLTDDVRLYGEVGWGFYTDVSKPWEFQFGVDYSPLTPTGIRGAPFAAINGQLRQEVNYSGNVVVQAGWQWRARNRGQLFRVGMQYYNGKSDQYEFYNQNENKLGVGLWYDY